MPAKVQLEFALKTEKIQLDKSDITKYKEMTYAPLKRESGFATDHVLTRIQQIIFPYEVHMIMHEKRIAGCAHND